MATSQPQKGHGRARPASAAKGPPAPSISPTSDISVQPSPTSETQTDTHFESGVSTTQSTATTPKSVGRGRALPKKNVIPHDPYWIVSNLTHQQFFTNERPHKPDELGTVGKVVTLLATYFQIFKFPHRGLVYKYQIQIKDRKDREIHRDRRRYLTFFNNFSSSLHIFDLFQCTIQCLVRDVL